MSERMQRFDPYSFQSYPRYPHSSQAVFPQARAIGRLGMERQKNLWETRFVARNYTCMNNENDTGMKSIGELAKAVLEELARKLVEQRRVSNG